MVRKLKIAILDSGIDFSHSYLNEKIIWGCTVKSDLKILEGKYEDSNGHGTNIASVITKENPNIEIYPIKIFDVHGQTSLLILEKALLIANSLNVDLINLSLSILDKFASTDLEKICQKIIDEGKIIISSQSNTNKKSYPAYFRSCIGVRGHILESTSSYWFNPYKRIQVVIDSEPFFHASLNGKYTMFGKSNSYASAKFSGVISKIIERNDIYDIEKIYELLKKDASKNWWANYHLRHSYRFPEFKIFEEKSHNKKLAKSIEKILLNYLKLANEKTLHFHSLYSQENGLKYEQCFDLILQLESYFNLSIREYSEISRGDFYSFARIVELVQLYL
ncbi:MAG: S8 family serine peptidase [Enterococcus sp.]